MKVLRVIVTMDPSYGGPCQGIRNSIPELQKLGVYSEVVCLDDPGASYLVNEQFPINAIGRAKNPWCYSSKFFPWLITNLPRFDAVIVHGLWLYHSYAVRRAIKFLESNKDNPSIKLPKVYIMPHGMFDPYFQKAAGRKLKALRNWVYWKLIENFVVNNADGLFFTCKEELLLAREPFRPYKPFKEFNIGYGITDPPASTPALRKAFLEKCPTIYNRPYLLFLSRIDHKKGVDLLIQAYSKILLKRVEELSDKLQAEKGIPISLIERMPFLVIAGPGTDSPYGKRIRTLVSKLPILKDMTLFPGMLSGDAKWGAFYGCEAFILPSHQENFGIAIVEALACGRPVLISNKVNIWREVKTGDGGIIAEDNLDGTLALLEQWLNLPNERKVLMGQSARATFVKNFNIHVSSLKLMAVLTKSLD